MLFAVDIGNSSVSFGVFDRNGQLCLNSKVETGKGKSADEYAVLLRGVLDLYGFDASRMTGAIVSSVVPPLTRTVCTALERLFGVRPMEVGPGIRTGLNIKIDLQSQLGADIVANAVAALSPAPQGTQTAAPGFGQLPPETLTPVVIVDFGTATTFTVINRQGVLEGVLIAPGMRVSLDALARSGAELPDSPLLPPRRLIAKNTQDAMRAGVLYGHAAMTDGLIDRIREHLEEASVTVIATGGLAEAVLPYCRTPLLHRPDLTLTGLYLIYQKNRK